MKAERRPEERRQQGGGVSTSTESHFPTSNLSVADIAEAFNATVVDDSESLGAQVTFAKTWNEAQDSIDIPTEPRWTGRPYARRSLTSRAASMQADPRGHMRRQVLDVIKVQGPLTDDAIAAEFGTDSNSVRPRRLELFRRGQIREAGKQQTRSGRWAQAWEAI
jgi:hypothetical protein